MLSYNITRLIVRVKIHTIGSISIHLKAGFFLPHSAVSGAGHWGYFHIQTGPVVQPLSVTVSGELGPTAAGVFWEGKPLYIGTASPVWHYVEVTVDTHIQTECVPNCLPLKWLCPTQAHLVHGPGGRREKSEWKETAVFTNVVKVSH